jgi:hypothetical protein
MELERGYQTAMKRDLARTPMRLKAAGAGYPARDEVHERDSRIEPEMPPAPLSLPFPDGGVIGRKTCCW